MFTANTPFSRNIRARHMSDAILLAGTPPGVVRSGAMGPVCVYWHAKVCAKMTVPEQATVGSSAPKKRWNSTQGVKWPTREVSEGGIILKLQLSL
jgi:hypothetical protein